MRLHNRKKSWHALTIRILANFLYVIITKSRILVFSPRLSWKKKLQYYKPLTYIFLKRCELAEVSFEQKNHWVCFVQDDEFIDISWDVVVALFL